MKRKTKKWIKEEAIPFCIFILFLGGIMWFIWAGVIKPEIEENELCAKAHGVDYGVWMGFEEEPINYKHINETHFICCVSKKWVDDNGAYHEQKCREFIKIYGGDENE